MKDYVEKVLKLEFYKGEDLYSDGDIEDKILEICEEYGDDVREVLKTQSDWPLLYHLSEVRQNILEWYDFNPEANLLEIGAGCGAITGLFCNKVKRVVGIDLSKRRSLINATRNGGKGNLEIIVGNFEDISIEETFDYVTLIGVLEYSPLYISKGENPFTTMLEKVKKFLKPNGKLMIAIENKFGLKYMAGTAEDHTGQFFEGVENYQNTSHVYTFSKPEITKLLKDSGFIKNEFYYPVPDYKLPNVIYSENYLPQKGDLTHIANAYDRKRYETFNEEAVFDSFCEDGQFEYFANSFLIISSLV